MEPVLRIFPKWKLHACIKITLVLNEQELQRPPISQTNYQPFSTDNQLLIQLFSQSFHRHGIHGPSLHESECHDCSRHPPPFHDPLLSHLPPHQMHQSGPIKVTKSTITDNTNWLPATELNRKYAKLS